MAPAACQADVLDPPVALRWGHVARAAAAHPGNEGHEADQVTCFPDTGQEGEGDVLSLCHQCNLNRSHDVPL